MTWYTNTCSITAMALLFYKFDAMVTNIYDYIIMGLRSNVCFVTDAPCLNEGVTVTALLVAWAT